MVITNLYKSTKKLLSNQPLNSSTEVRLTRLCTQRCRQCRVYERTTEPANMTLNMFSIIAQRLREYGSHIGFISGGEATLVPDLQDILTMAKEVFSTATTLVTGLYNKTSTIRRNAQVCLANNINIQTSLDGLGSTGDKLRGVAKFDRTVMQHMQMISEMRGMSRSLLYVNIVVNNVNVGQVPELIERAKSMGWQITIGLYHSLTETTRKDDDLKVRPGPELDGLIKLLENNKDILNLNSFIKGINPFLRWGAAPQCPFVRARFLMTRTTIMENGDVHLCWGGPIGNLFKETLYDIFSSEAYKNRMNEYKKCAGCWTTCYTQRYLLIYPSSIEDLTDNVYKVFQLRRMSKNHRSH